MQMEMFWMLLLLLLCRSSHSRTTIDRIFHANFGDNVLLPCLNNTFSHAREDLTFQLLKDEKIIMDTYSHKKKNQTSQAVELDSSDRQSFRFMLYGVNSSSCGIYRCQTAVLFPPPMRPLATGENILLLVTDTPRFSPSPKPDTEGHCGSHWFWIITGIFGIYGIIITIVAVIMQVKMRNAECQNDYMNTKPKVSREHRKKKGLQNPAPWYC